MSTPYTEADLEMAVAASWQAAMPDALGGPPPICRVTTRAGLDALAAAGRFAPTRAEAARSRQVRDAILANAHADADRAHQMHDTAADEVDKLHADRRRLRRALTDLARRMVDRAHEADAPADGAAMDGFAAEIRALADGLRSRTAPTTERGN
ncbi:hypothetical protein [Micromonospora haikouensis]|uniref:hypothetical protein n=1 Tax=Micromonospora haikouensis TaxID=686309 RepID=UPI003D71D52A